MEYFVRRYNKAGSASAAPLAINFMRVLIIIPPTFIAGIYGMNVDPDAGAWNMPELRLPFGYIGVMGLMAAILVGMLIYFKRKDWL